MTDTASRTALSSPTLKLTLAMVIIGTIGAFVIETGLDPVTVVFWRCIFASLFLGAWCVLRGYLPDPSLTWRGIGMAVLIGVCLVVNWVAFFASFPMTTIATTTIVYHVQPFMVVLIGVVFLGERVSAGQILWIVGAFVGLVLSSGILGHPASASGDRWLLGIGLTLFAALLYAIATILAKQLGRQRPEVTTLCQTVIGALMLAPFASYSIPSAAWSWLVGIGVLHTGISYALMYAAYPRLSTPAIAILNFVYPLVAILIDWSIYNHPLSVTQGIGLVVIAACTIGFKLRLSAPKRLELPERSRGPVR